MPLTIPQARTPFDPVRQPRLSQSMARPGDGLANLGAAGVDAVVQSRKRAEAGQMREARVSAAESIGEIRTRYENDPNFAGLGDRFAAELEGVGKEISDTLPEGRLRDAFGQDFRAMSGPQLQSILNRQYALERDAGRAGLSATLRSLEAEAANAPDADSRGALMSVAAAEIGAAQGAGLLTAQEADGLITGTITNTTENAALMALADDPAGFLERDEAGEFAGLAPKRLTELRVRARVAVASEAARVAAEAETEQTRIAEELTLDVDAAIDILESGLPFAGINGLLTRSRGTDDGRRLRATLAAVSTEDNFTILTPSAQREVIATIAATPTNDPDDIERLARLREIRKKTIESLENDPFAHVSDRGIAAVPALDITSAASVRRRIALAKTIVRRYGQDLPALRLFTNAERAAFERQIEDGSVDSQLAIVAGVIDGFGRDFAVVALNEISARDPLFNLAGQLVIMNNDIGPARIMLQGRQLLKDGTGAKPGKAVHDTVRAEVAAAFPPQMGGNLATLMEGADAHYAASGQGTDPEDGADGQAEAYRRSVQAVSGQRVEGGVTLGGIQEVHGRPTYLAGNMSAGMVEAALLTSTVADWQAASISGEVPVWGDRPVVEEDAKGGARQPPSVRGRLRLLLLGQGQYLVGIERNDGEQRWLIDKGTDDGFVRIDLATLIAALHVRREAQ